MKKEEIEQNIKEEIVKTEILITEYKELTKPVAPDDAIGRITRMDAINNKSINDANLSQARRKKHQLTEMLASVGSS